MHTTGSRITLCTSVGCASNGSNSAGALVPQAAEVGLTALAGRQKAWQTALLWFPLQQGKPDIDAASQRNARCRHRPGQLSPLHQAGDQQPDGSLAGVCKPESSLQQVGPHSGRPIGRTVAQQIASQHEWLGGVWLCPAVLSRRVLPPLLLCTFRICLRADAFVGGGQCLQLICSPRCTGRLLYAGRVIICRLGDRYRHQCCAMYCRCTAGPAVQMQCSAEVHRMTCSKIFVLESLK